MVANELMKKQLFFIMMSAVMCGSVGQAFGADVVLDNTSSPTTVSADDNVTLMLVRMVIRKATGSL